MAFHEDFPHNASTATDEFRFLRFLDVEDFTFTAADDFTLAHADDFASMAADDFTLATADEFTATAADDFTLTTADLQGTSQPQPNYPENAQAPVEPTLYNTGMHGYDHSIGSGGLGHCQTLVKTSPAYSSPYVNDQHLRGDLTLPLFSTDFNELYDDTASFGQGHDMAIASGINASREVSLLDHSAREAGNIEPMYLYADHSEMGPDFINFSSGLTTHLDGVPRLTTATTSQGTIDPALLSTTMCNETGNTSEFFDEQPNFGLVPPVVSTETKSSKPHTTENYQRVEYGTQQAQDMALHGHESQPGDNVSANDTLQPAYPDHSIVSHWGLTQQMEHAQDSHLHVQHQAMEYDVPLEHLLYDPDFQQYLKPPRDSRQMEPSLNSVASGRVLKPVMTKAGKPAKYRMDGKLRKSTLGPLADKPAEELQAPDIDLTGSDVVCFFPNYIRRPGFMTRMLGNGFSSRALAAIINYYNGTDKTGNSINNGCIREAREGWHLNAADKKLSLKELRARNLLTVDNSLRIRSDDLPHSKAGGGEIASSRVTLMSIAQGVHQWPKVGGRFWTPTAAAIKWCFDHHEEGYRVNDIPALAGWLGVSMPPPLPNLNYDQELLEFVEDHILKESHSCPECV